MNDVLKTLASEQQKAEVPDVRPGDTVAVSVRVVEGNRERLQKFEGTIFLVTHDEDLLDEVGTRVWRFDHGQIEDFKGTYEELTGGPDAPESSSRGASSPSARR